MERIDFYVPTVCRQDPFSAVNNSRLTYNLETLVSEKKLTCMIVSKEHKLGIVAARDGSIRVFDMQVDFKTLPLII